MSKSQSKLNETVIDNETGFKIASYEPKQEDGEQNYFQIISQRILQHCKELAEGKSNREQEALKTIAKTMSAGVRRFEWCYAPALMEQPTEDIDVVLTALNSAVVLKKDGTLESMGSFFYDPTSFFREEFIRDQSFGLGNYDNKARLIENVRVKINSKNYLDSQYSGVTSEWLRAKEKDIFRDFSTSVTMSEKIGYMPLPNKIVMQGKTQPDDTGRYPMRPLRKDGVLAGLWEKAFEVNVCKAYEALREDFVSRLNPQILKTMKATLLSSVNDYNWIAANKSFPEKKAHISNIRMQILEHFPLFAKCFVEPNIAMDSLLTKTESQKSFDIKSFAEGLAKIYDCDLNAIRQLHKISPEDLSLKDSMGGPALYKFIQNLNIDEINLGHQSKRIAIKQKMASDALTKAIQKYLPDFSTGASPALNEKGIEGIQEAIDYLDLVALDMRQIFIHPKYERKEVPLNELSGENGVKKYENSLFKVFCGDLSVPNIAKKINDWYKSRLSLNGPQMRLHEMKNHPEKNPKEGNFPLFSKPLLLSTGGSAEFIVNKEQLREIERNHPNVPATSLIEDIISGKAVAKISNSKKEGLGLIVMDFGDYDEKIEDFGATNLAVKSFTSFKFAEKLTTYEKHEINTALEIAALNIQEMSRLKIIDNNPEKWRTQKFNRQTHNSSYLHVNSEAIQPIQANALKIIMGAQSASLNQQSANIDQIFKENIVLYNSRLERLHDKCQKYYQQKQSVDPNLIKEPVAQPVAKEPAMTM